MMGRLAELLMFGISPLLIAGALLPVAFAKGNQRRLVGEVYYRERIALPPDAVLTVQLAGPDGVVAEQTIAPAGQVPIWFEIEPGEAVLHPDSTWIVHAAITVNGAPMFVGDPPHAFDTASGSPQRILLRRVG
jgi:putative lipoprotein